jgi:uncharacterized protein
MKFQNKSIVLTGAASGIGKSLLALLAKEQCTLIAADYNADLLQSTIQEISIIKDSQAVIFPFIGDISQQTQVDNLFLFALEKCPNIDIFIANAGFAYYEKIGETNWQHTEKIFQLNVFSPIYAFQKMKVLNLNRHYIFCTTASAMAKMGLAGYALYSATKAALDRFSEAYRAEKDDLGVFSVVYPVATRTNFFQKTNSPVLFPSQSAVQVAKAIFRGIENEKTRIFPSNIFKIGYFFGFLQEFISKPYQYYCKKVFQKWLYKNRKN